MKRLFKFQFYDSTIKSVATAIHDNGGYAFQFYDSTIKREMMAKW